MSNEGKARQLLIPQYNELSLFLMSCAILTLFLIDPLLRLEFRDTIAEDKWDPRTYLAVAIFALGMFFSIRHLFTLRPKTEWEKSCMLFFAILVNGISAVAAGLHVIEIDSFDWMMLFPLWNLINGIILIALYRCDHITEENAIIDDNATIPQAMLGLLIIAATIAVGHVIFQLYWAMTFSMCVTYASNFDRLLHGMMNRTARKS